MSSNENIEVIKRVYSGINRNDIESVLSLFDENILRIEPENFPGAGTYRGHADMRSHLIKGRSTWAEGGCYPVEFFTAGNKTAVIVHIKVRLKDKSNFSDVKIADGFSIKEGRVTEFHSFANKQKAFEWAGIQSGA